MPNAHGRLEAPRQSDHLNAGRTVLRGAIRTARAAGVRRCSRGAENGEGRPPSRAAGTKLLQAPFWRCPCNTAERETAAVPLARDRGELAGILGVDVFGCSLMLMYSKLHPENVKFFVVVPPVPPLPPKPGDSTRVRGVSISGRDATVVPTDRPRCDLPAFGGHVECKTAVDGFAVQ